MSAAPIEITFSENQKSMAGVINPLLGTPKTKLPPKVKVAARRRVRSSSRGENQ